MVTTLASLAHNQLAPLHLRNIVTQAKIALASTLHEQLPLIWIGVNQMSIPDAIWIRSAI